MVLILCVAVLLTAGWLIAVDGKRRKRKLIAARRQSLREAAYLAGDRRWDR